MPIAEGQSWEAQEERLRNGCCPIHGLVLTQVGTWYKRPAADREFTIVACPRKDCDVHAMQSDPAGLCELLFQNVSILAYACGDYMVDDKGTVAWTCPEELVEV